MVNITPYHQPPRVADAVQDHRAALVLVNADGTTHPLDGLLAGRIGWDQSRAPRVELNATLAVPNDDRLMAALDPRFAATVRVYAGWRDDVPMVADLPLRRRTVNRPADTLDLTAESSEAIVLDDGQHFSSGTITYPSIRDAIRAQVEGAYTPRRWVVTGSDSTTTDVDITGASRWDIIDDLADREGLDVYDDGTGVWHIEPRTNTTATEPHHYMEVGPTSTLTSSNATITRGGGAFYNRVQLFYSWTDAADVDHTVKVRREITSGPFAAAVGTRVTYSEDRRVSTTPAAAAQAALHLLRRVVTRGRAYTLDGVAAYWLRPGHTVSVLLPTGTQEDQLVESVDFDLAAGSMSVTMRVADDSTYDVTPA